LANGRQSGRRECNVGTGYYLGAGYIIKANSEKKPSYPVGTSNFKVGNLYDASGKTKDKNTETLKCGDQIGVYLDEVEYLVDLPVYPRYAGNDLHDAMPYLTWNSKGELNVLVVPFYYEDQESLANTTNLNYIKQSLGRVIEMDGSITTYSPETSGVFSLSEYFDIASYGKVKINSFVTEWKGMQGIFNGDKESDRIWESNLDEIGTWVVENYANQLSILDADKNGIFDAVILVCAPPSGNAVSYSPVSNNGAYKSAFSAETERVRQDGTPVINTYSFVNERMVFEGREISTKQMETGTLIHEFSHGFGLIDYYDVSYSGMNAVGGYDMESNNAGDWNVYSKYAVGWVEPIVVTPAEIEEKGSVEVTISSFADTGSFLVIPTVNTEVREGQLMTPFEEYLAIELFKPTGVNRYDASKVGLGSVTGVRIYHIDAKRILLNRTDNVHNTQYSFGETMKTNAYNINGLYQVEVIQKGGTNLFGNPKKYRSITASDFFYAGDSFSMKKHADFFLNGLMDDRSEFPYTISVKSIRDGKATIVISK